MVAGLKQLCIVGAGVEVERHLSSFVVEADAVENGAEGFSFVGSRGGVLGGARKLCHRSQERQNLYFYEPNATNANAQP